MGEWVKLLFGNAHLNLNFFNTSFPWASFSKENSTTRKHFPILTACDLKFTPGLFYKGHNFISLGCDDLTVVGISYKYINTCQLNWRRGERSRNSRSQSSDDTQGMVGDFCPSTFCQMPWRLAKAVRSLRAADKRGCGIILMNLNLGRLPKKVILLKYLMTRCQPGRVLAQHMQVVLGPHKEQAGGGFVFNWGETKKLQPIRPSKCSIL